MFYKQGKSVRSKEANIGLSFPVSVDYVKKNTTPDLKQQNKI